ncbi:hypothetical protein WUBG_02079 [Wuchereria bancrofti]|uniref:Uncharacterized protein n=1 Tax=Wuchereria bancrofti TaxID=6293 RepID=J9FI35_WUCBA|nr:hypothetical protein WUBG_02079 [Wuchereria bancrofti]
MLRISHEEKANNATRVCHISNLRPATHNSRRDHTRTPDRSNQSLARPSPTISKLQHHKQECILDHMRLMFIDSHLLSTTKNVQYSDQGGHDATEFGSVM